MVPRSQMSASVAPPNRASSLASTERVRSATLTRSLRRCLCEIPAALVDCRRHRRYAGCSIDGLQCRHCCLTWLKPGKTGRASPGYQGTEESSETTVVLIEILGGSMYFTPICTAATFS